jgi:hypothetical protein
MKIKIKNLLLVLALSAASASAQNTAAEIIENSLQALGGRKEIAKVRSLHAVADCTGPNGNYTTEIYSARDGRLVFAQAGANGNLYLGQTNGEVYWTKKTRRFRPRRPPRGGGLARSRFSVSGDGSGDPLSRFSFGRRRKFRRKNRRQAKR